jgi:tRNA (guanine37-N1)-methyltransferase
MRIDIVTIFPEFFDVLDVSLVGKARESGLVQIDAVNLRDFTHDVHKTVDDSPYGGGAGMVMRPEPWGEALDSLITDDTVLVVPSPAGEVFSQPIARELALESHLVFACGRYEGIDQRVIDHYGTRIRVRELSLGDYVLNGGEVATMAMIEAVTRLDPRDGGQPRVTDGGKPRRRAARIPVVHEASGVARVECPRNSLVGASRKNHGVAQGTAGRAHSRTSTRPLALEPGSVGQDNRPVRGDGNGVFGVSAARTVSRT